MPERRALLLDASCVVPAGHNGRLCRLFARLLEARGYRVGYLIPTHAAAAFPGEETAVQRALPYPYWRRYGHLAGFPDHPLDRPLNAIVERAHGTGLLARLLRLNADAELSRVMAKGFAPVLDAQGLGPRDLVMLPTADLYGSSALLAWLGRRDPAASPAVLLRFLNILETEALHAPYRRLKALLRRAVGLHRRGHRVHLAAEVEPWAQRLERRIDGALTVPVVPAPPQAPARSAPRDPNRLGLSLISLRRTEQGMQRLPAILEAIPADLRGRLDIVAQQPAIGSVNYEQRMAFTRRAQALGLRFVDDQLDDRALVAALGELDLSLLPYLPERYRTRGSSMFFEAADQGHVVLASAGCGFSAAVEAFGLGRLCASDAAFSEALNALLRQVARGEHPRFRSGAAAAVYNAQRQRQVDSTFDAIERDSQKR